MALCPVIIWYIARSRAIARYAKSTLLAFRGSTPNPRYWPQRLKTLHVRLVHLETGDFGEKMLTIIKVVFFIEI